MYMYMYTYLLCVEAISHNLFYSQFTPEYQQILLHIGPKKLLLLLLHKLTRQKCCVYPSVVYNVCIVAKRCILPRWILPNEKPSCR